MMYRHNNTAVNLDNIRTMKITENAGRSAGRWNILITYSDSQTICINGLTEEGANNLFNNMIIAINGGK